MNRIKKIIGVIVISMFLSALTLNFGLFKTVSADHNPCPGWDGTTVYWGYLGNEINPCGWTNMCVETCPY